MPGAAQSTRSAAHSACTTVATGPGPAEQSREQRGALYDLAEVPGAPPTPTHLLPPRSKDRFGNSALHKGDPAHLPTPDGNIPLWPPTKPCQRRSERGQELTEQQDPTQDRSRVQLPLGSPFSPNFSACPAHTVRALCDVAGPWHPPCQCRYFPNIPI